MTSMLEFVPPLLRGAGITLQITIYSALIASAIALIAGLSRLSKNIFIRSLAGTYVEIFRGTSLLVQLFWIFFALPIFGIKIPAFIAGLLALGLNFGAYGAEIVRSSILAIPKGQTEATIALNMSSFQKMRLVLLPQAFRMMLPAFGNQLIELLKATSLVSFVTLADMTFQGMSLSITTMRTTEVFTLLLILYFLLSYPLTWSVRWLERKVSIGG